MSDGIEIVWGETTAAHAHLYFRATGDQEKIIHLTGTLSGPASIYAKTLPARFSLCPVEPGSDLLAKLVVPDPCFWTPDLPLLYQLDLQLQDAAGAVHKISRLVGIRHWGVDRTALRMAGRRIVLRGLNVGPDDISRAQLTQAHEMQLTLMVPQPDEACCEAASRVGVGLIADLRGVCEWPVISHQLTRVSRWPSVLMALVEPIQVAAENWSTARLPIFHSFNPIDGEIASWADGGLIELDQSNPLPARYATTEKPLLAIRHDPGEHELSTIRQACDRLQSDLAPQLDLAGYFVKR